MLPQTTSTTFRPPRRLFRHFPCLCKRAAFPNCLKMQQFPALGIMGIFPDLPPLPPPLPIIASCFAGTWSVLFARLHPLCYCFALAAPLYPRCPLKKFYLNRKFLLSGRPAPVSSVAEADPRNRRRSERVFVQIPVLFEIPQPGGRPLHGDAYTLCVNAHGGLMELGVSMQRGQKFALSNPGTADSRSCQVIRCDRSRNGYFAVSFEFETPAGDFWPILSTPTDWKAFQD